MKNLFPFFLLLLVGLSCSDDLAKTESEQVVEALGDKPIKAQIKDFASSRSDSYSYGKRTDAVEVLFNEAIENDKNLEKLVEKLNNINSDAIGEYSKYKTNNENYWASVSSNGQNLRDTVLREEVAKYFDKLRQRYANSISKHEYNVKLFNEKEIELSDQSILLKLAVTQPMMESYQKNELVELQKLQRITKTYDSLINILEQKTKSIR